MYRCTLCLLAASALSGCASYHPANYTGDGTMYAIPNSTPKYDLELEPISLARPGHAEFQLTNLPTDNLLALLSVNDPTPEILSALEKSGVRVTMILTDHNAGRTSAKKGYLLADWSPTPESWRSIPAEYEGVWFRAVRHSRFTLSIDVELDHPEVTPGIINATPHVRGGGFGTH